MCVGHNIGALSPRGTRGMPVCDHTRSVTTHCLPVQAEQDTRVNAYSDVRRQLTLSH